MNGTNFWRFVRVVALVTLSSVIGASPLHAQGVTTGAVAGIVSDAQGAVVPGATVTAVHQPSGTAYEAVTQTDGRFVMPAVRVGGPYRVSAMLTGFGTEVHENV